eukprot:CAMPEP_0119262610 /NCGR_PEP_ID=MMETSP1329-20130426/2275_1 /TAXON_ID=114041 /ORGANISM="Genus nov. species nov., Strain RCC1024" /LENGTH=581 /DNA_ID=CAMNT_0007262271 /DNA_START=49 /DNA_END=1794 /DNA_ORIENTATION=-
MLEHLRPPEGRSIFSDPPSAPLTSHSESWAIGGAWGASDEAPKPLESSEETTDLGLRLDDSLTFDEPASFSAKATEFKPRASSFEQRRPAHPLAEFFLPASAETRSLAVVGSGLDAERVVDTASRYGTVSGVDDSYVTLDVVFLQFDDARDCAAARATLAADLSASGTGGEPSCEGVIFGPAPRALVIAGLPGHTTAADVRAVFAANSYGDVATVRRWRDGSEGAFEVRFWARSGAERAALELSRSEQAVGKGGRVSVDYVPLAPGTEQRDADLRRALEAALERHAAAAVDADDPWAEHYSSMTPDAPSFVPGGAYEPGLAASAPSFIPRTASDPYAPGFGSALDQGSMRRSASDWQVGYGAAPAPFDPYAQQLSPRVRQEHLTPKEAVENYAFDADAATAGLDPRTTLMVRNIPNKYTQRAVLEEIDVKFARTYDFFYLPIDFKNKCNVGYAFINLVEPKDALALFEEFNGRRWTCFRSGKVCAITYARIQGKHMMIERFKNSSLLNESVEVQPRLFVSEGPNKGAPEQFPGGAPIPHDADYLARTAPAPAPAAPKNPAPKEARGGRNRNRGGRGRKPSS